MVPILSPCARAKSMRSSSRAMVPSSLMISQITPLGLRPARRDDIDRGLGMAGADEDSAGARDQGEDMARRDDRIAAIGESIATAMVRARSAALMPVEIPSLASIETVKAVSLRLWLVRVIGSSPSWSARSLVMARQISPRPWRAMKLIASGVAICAGMIRSPSFSRSSSSTRMNMRPLRASLMIASAPTSTSVVPRWISFSSRIRVSAVGFHSSEPNLRKLWGGGRRRGPGRRG